MNRQQQMNFISEPNFYKCIFQSRKKEAEVFQDWVCGEVLPSIRKTGGYMVARNDETPEEIMAKALQIANETLVRRQRQLEQQLHTIEQQDQTISKQSEQLREAAPKVEYYDTTLQSVNTLTTTQVAKEIGLDAAKLNRRLRDCGVLYSQSGQWQLRAPYSTWHLHATRTQTYTRTDGSVGTTLYTVWTQRGRRFILSLAQRQWNVRATVRALKAISQ